MTPKIKINVQGVASNHTRTDIRAGSEGQFHLVSDEPALRGGNDEGMLPLEIFLGGYLACTNVIMNLVAKDLGITFDDVEFKVTGYLDPRGLAGQEVLKTPFAKVTLSVKGHISGNTGQLDELRSQLAWRCPAAATLRSAGTEIVETWNMAET